MTSCKKSIAPREQRLQRRKPCGPQRLQPVLLLSTPVTGTLSRGLPRGRLAVSRLLSSRLVGAPCRRRARSTQQPAAYCKQERQELLLVPVRTGRLLAGTSLSSCVCGCAPAGSSQLRPQWRPRAHAP